MPYFSTWQRLRIIMVMADAMDTNTHRLYPVPANNQIVYHFDPPAINSVAARNILRLMAASEKLWEEPHALLSHLFGLADDRAALQAMLASNKKPAP